MISVFQIIEGWCWNGVSVQQKRNFSLNVFEFWEMDGYSYHFQILCLKVTLESGFRNFSPNVNFEPFHLDWILFQKVRSWNSPLPGWRNLKLGDTKSKAALIISLQFRPIWLIQRVVEKTRCSHPLRIPHRRTLWMNKQHNLKWSSISMKL